MTLETQGQTNQKLKTNVGCIFRWKNASLDLLLDTNLNLAALWKANRQPISARPRRPPPGPPHGPTAQPCTQVRSIRGAVHTAQPKPNDDDERGVGGLEQIAQDITHINGSGIEESPRESVTSAIKMSLRDESFEIWGGWESGQPRHPQPDEGVWSGVL